MKKLVTLTLTVLLCLATVFMLAACTETPDDDKDSEIYAAYTAYLAAAAEEGIEPMDYDTWLATIKGEKGDKGDKGDKGADGLTPFIGENGNWWIGTTDTGVSATGSNGQNGTPGKSAYEIWLEAGNTGTEEDFLASLRGQDGTPGAPGAPGTPGTPGAPGKSAYQIWLEAGNTGTEEDFLTSLRGQDGTPGTPGAPGAPGTPGKSAYQIWLEAGNTGTEEDFLASLRGQDGTPGAPGTPGTPGEDGRGVENIEMVTEERDDGTYLIFRVYYTDGKGDYEEYSVLLPAGGGSQTPPDENDEILFVYMDKESYIETVGLDLAEFVEKNIIGETLYVERRYTSEEIVITPEMVEYDDAADTSVEGTLYINVHFPDDLTYYCEIRLQLIPDLSALEKLGTYTLTGMLAASLGEGEEGTTMTLFAGDKPTAAMQSAGSEGYDYITTYSYYDEEGGIIKLLIHDIGIAVLLDDEQATAEFYLSWEAAVTYSIPDSESTFAFYTVPTDSGEYLCTIKQVVKWEDEETGEVYSDIAYIAAFITYDATTKSFYSPFEDEIYVIGEGTVLTTAVTVNLVVMNDTLDDAAISKKVGLFGEITIAEFLALNIEGYDKLAAPVFLVNYQIVDGDYILKADDIIWVAPQNGMIVSMTYDISTMPVIVPIDCTVETFLGMYGMPNTAIVTVNGEAADLNTVLEDGDTVTVAAGEITPSPEPAPDTEE